MELFSERISIFLFPSSCSRLLIFPPCSRFVAICLNVLFRARERTFRFHSFSIQFRVSTGTLVPWLCPPFFPPFVYKRLARIKRRGHIENRRPGISSPPYLKARDKRAFFSNNFLEMADLKRNDELKCSFSLIELPQWHALSRVILIIPGCFTVHWLLDS